MGTELTSPFTQEDDRPLPLIVAEKWDFPLQHHITLEGTYYAVQDWIAGLVGKESASQALRNLKRDNQSVFSKHTLPYIGNDGKTYKRDFTDDKGLYLIAQHLRVTKEREVLDAIRRYLAAAGVLVDEIRRDPEILAEMMTTDDPEALIHASMDKWRRDGKADSWIEARISGIVTRKQFTEALRDAVLNAPIILFAQATDKVYMGLWNRTTAQLRGELKITPRQNVRDHFGVYALIYTRLAEQLATDKLGNAEIVEIDTAMQIVLAAAKLIRKQAQATAKELGIDLITEKPLLKTGK